MLNKFLSLILTLALLNSCSTAVMSNRLPASATDEISYYLSIDKFKYYLNEYSVAMEGKVPDEIVEAVRSLSVEDIINMHLDAAELSGAENYDGMIYDFLKSKNLVKGVKKEDLQWNYNFFKNKLNEAFTLAPSKLDIDLAIKSDAKPLTSDIPVAAEILNADDMTLDSGHYISNRTTRAIFWEAIENNRTIEFHLGDSREFLKQLKEQNGEILYEVKPLAKNYNKIFVIKYPNDPEYRYAITNIGGKDRLDHLVHQISLSNFKGKKITNKIVVKGDLKKFHATKAEEHTMQLRLLPKADRVIIGQKESIDGKFGLFWKIRALKNLYDSDPDLYNKRIDAKTHAKLQSFEQSPFEILFKDKKVVEDAYLAFEKEFEENPDLSPGKFKMYNYDNFTIEMCDYVFTTKDNKNFRWRVVSNVWGDEIVPIAQAFKNTGHTNVVYMGTAGAFADKNYKVGDLVIPAAVNYNDTQVGVKSAPMKIEGAKYGGTVEHVGSPFEESVAWLEKARARSELVEVETSYLRQIFNAPTDNVEMYLLVSDILGSESETLAHATSSKRKNSQNKLLAKLFERDAKGFPVPAKTLVQNSVEARRAQILKVLPKKTTAFRYYVQQSFAKTKEVTDAEILKFAEEKPAFTDSFILERLVKTSEVVHEMNKRTQGKAPFDVAFSKSLVEGTWNPKSEKLQIVFKPRTKEAEKVISANLSSMGDAVGKLKAFAEISVNMEIDTPDIVWMKIPEKTDPDFLVKVYSLSGFKNAGLYHNVTYNGNLTLDMLPIAKTEQPLEAFYQGVATAKKPEGGVIGNCMDAMKALMTMF